MPAVTLDRVRLHYEESGAGTPLLGIHGTPGSAALWEDAARQLSKHSRCIVYDRRGFHRSLVADGAAALDLEDHVDDALALLAAREARPAVVVGRSTGGLVALALALREPGAVVALALLEPAVFTVDPDAATWAADLRERVLAWAATDPGLAARAVVIEALGEEVWDAWPQELRDLVDATSPAVLAEARGRGLDLSADPWTPGPAALAGLRMPTLLVSGADSPAPLRVVGGRLAERIPAAESVVVPGGHLIDPAHPSVLAFVDRHTI